MLLFLLRATTRTYHHDEHANNNNNNTSAVMVSTMDQVSVGSSTTLASAIMTHATRGGCIGSILLLTRQHLHKTHHARADEIRHRVRWLLASQSQSQSQAQLLDAAKLPGLYRSRYQHNLNVEALGYAKLRAFLESVPGVQLHCSSPSEGGPPLLLGSRPRVPQDCGDNQQCGAAPLLVDDGGRRPHPRPRRGSGGGAPEPRFSLVGRGQDSRPVSLPLPRRTPQSGSARLRQTARLFGDHSRPGTAVGDDGAAADRGVAARRRRRSTTTTQWQQHDEDRGWLSVVVVVVLSYHHHTALTATQDPTLARQRIVQLLEQQLGRPLDACKLPVLYRSRYRETLVPEQLGFAKLRALLESMPRVVLREAKTGPPLLLELLREEAEEEKDAPPTKKSSPALEARDVQEQPQSGSCSSNNMCSPTRPAAEAPKTTTPPSPPRRPLNPNAPSYLDVARSAAEEQANNNTAVVVVDDSHNNQVLCEIPHDFFDPWQPPVAPSAEDAWEAAPPYQYNNNNYQQHDYSAASGGDVVAAEEWQAPYPSPVYPNLEQQPSYPPVSPGPWEVEQPSPVVPPHETEEEVGEEEQQPELEEKKQL